MSPELSADHYRQIGKAMLHGRVIPFLGAGVNLCGRSQGTEWQKGTQLPSGGELSKYLGRNFGYPEKTQNDPEIYDLIRVSQYITVMNGSGPLYDKLHELFDVDYPPTAVHQFFGALPNIVRQKASTPRFQLIITTNYDDVLERAFKQAGEPFDVVTYETEGENRGKFWHQPPNGEARLIEKPNEYTDVSPEKQTVILKIHGAVNRNSPDSDRDSYVITEDDYIEYLTRTDISHLVPTFLAARLKKSHFLFMGYGLRDWNLRVILHRIWGAQKLNYKSWAIQFKPDLLEQKFWDQRDVEILDIRLEDYMISLTESLHQIPAAAPSP